MMLSLEYFCTRFPLYLFKNRNNFLHQPQSTMNGAWILINSFLFYGCSPVNEAEMGHCHILQHDLWSFHPLHLKEWLTFAVYIWSSVQRISRGLYPFSTFYSHFVYGFLFHNFWGTVKMLLLILLKLQNLVTSLRNIVSTFSYIMGLAMIHNNPTTIRIILFFLTK